MSRTHDVIIAGGGLCGSLLALALARSGRSVALIEGRSLEELGQVERNGRTYALAVSSKSLLQSLGIWTEIEDHCQQVQDMVIEDGCPDPKESPFALHFELGEGDEGKLGYVVEDGCIREALFARMKDNAGIDLRAGTHVADHQVSAGHVDVPLTSGESLRCCLLVGSDGKSSRIARRSGIQKFGWTYPQRNLTCTISHELSHRGVAYQFFRPTGPLATLPMTGNRSTVYWTEEQETARQIQSLGDEEYLARLQSELGGLLGECSLAGNRAIFPLSLSVAERFVVERTALVGDAAHVIHPLAGQGLNIGIRDVAALADVVERAAGRGEDIGAETTLLRYQQLRRFDACLFGAVTDGLNRFYSNNIPLLPVVRRAAMGALNRMPGIKRKFMQAAAGFGESDSRIFR